jgi:hypothetical protein
MPARSAVIAITAALALVGGVIAGVAASQWKAPANLSAGENCDPSGQPSEGAQGTQQRQSTARIRHVGWEQRQPSAEPSDAPAEPSGEPSDAPAEPSGEPSDAPAEPSAEPSDNCDEEGGAGQQPSEQPSEEPSQQAAGPLEEDFVDINEVPPADEGQQPGENASTGTFVSECGTNENGHRNPDNYIVAPGTPNGAEHFHDYVGNVSTDNTSTDESLAAADTTCAQGDQSTYFWPVLRDTRGAEEDETGNVGEILQPDSAVMQFRGNAQSDVTAMPRFLRIITGNAKAATGGGANANAAWSCTGVENRVSPDKYPLCPEGSKVVRTLDFPSCWDGQNLDSADHRSHVVFPDEGSGACPEGTKAVPQLRMQLTFTVAQGRSFALDSFPDELNNPITDHGDFENVMPDALMQKAVDCINGGQDC